MSKQHVKNKYMYFWSINHESILIKRSLPKSEPVRKAAATDLALKGLPNKFKFRQSQVPVFFLSEGFVWIYIHTYINIYTDLSWVEFSLVRCPSQIRHDMSIYADTTNISIWKSNMKVKAFHVVSPAPEVCAATFRLEQRQVYPPGICKNKSFVSQVQYDRTGAVWVSQIFF